MITIPAPMQAPEALRQPFTDPGWLYEIKFDGFRCMAGIEKDDGYLPDSQKERHMQMALRVQLRTKSGANCSAWFPEIVEALATLPDGPHVIDGEAVVLREDGTSDFNALHSRGRRWKPGGPRVTFCAFDILVHNGRKVMGLPLVARKPLLAQLVSGVPGVLFVGDLPASAPMFEQMVAPPPEGLGLQIEGVMAKRRDSTYQPGLRSPDWVKIKRPGWNEGRTWNG